jgi:hypothetical protein
MLTSKRIKYTDLRRALVPSIDRHERALVFDYTRFDTLMYGRDVIHKLLPHLRPESTHSVLCGDWLRDGVFSKWLGISPGAIGTVNPERLDVPT